MADIIGSAESCWLSLTSGFDATWSVDLKTSSQALRASFIVPILCFAVVLFYSLLFRKPTQK